MQNEYWINVYKDENGQILQSSYCHWSKRLASITSNEMWLKSGMRTVYRLRVKSKPPWPTPVPKFEQQR